MEACQGQSGAGKRKAEQPMSVPIHKTLRPNTVELHNPVLVTLLNELSAIATDNSVGELSQGEAARVVYVCRASRLLLSTLKMHITDDDVPELKTWIVTKLENM